MNNLIKGSKEWVEAMDARIDELLNEAKSKTCDLQEKIKLYKECIRLANEIDVLSTE